MATTSFSVNLHGILAELGEQQVFTFQGTLGDRLFFDSIDTDPGFENIRLPADRPEWYYDIQQHPPCFR